MLFRKFENRKSITVMSTKWLTFTKELKQGFS